jgi:hypothetical protein
MGAAKGEKEKKVHEVLWDEFDQDLFDFEMKEDPEMYESTGIPLPAMSTPDDSVNIQKTIESAFSSLPAMQGSNVKVKVCVMRSNCGLVWNVNFRTCFEM